MEYCEALRYDEVLALLWLMVIDATTTELWGLGLRKYEPATPVITRVIFVYILAQVSQKMPISFLARIVSLMNSTILYKIGVTYYQLKI